MVNEMKKKYIIMAAALAVMACCKEETSVPGESSELLAVSEAGTKTHLEGTKVVWDKGDAINVFVKNDAGVYVSSTFATSESGSSVVFKGEGVKLDTDVYAVHPFSEGNTFSDGVFTTSIRTVAQKIVKDGYPADINVAVGRCDADKAVSFRNVGALLKFRLTQEGADTLRRIEIKANGGETIAAEGNVSIDWNNGEPRIAASEGTQVSDVVTLTPSAKTFVTGDAYHVWILPGKYEKGISLTLVSPSQMAAVKVGKEALEAGRNQIIDLGEIGGLTLKEKETEKMTLEFDFTGEAPEGWPTKDNWKKAGSGDCPAGVPCPGNLTAVYKHSNGNSYNFILTDVGNATAARVYWSADKGVVLGAVSRYFGFPAIEGYRLIKVSCVQGTGTSSKRKAAITSSVPESTDAQNTYVNGGGIIPWTTKGDTYSWNLEDTAVNTVYYLTCTQGGIGVSILTLTYEKAE